MSHSANPAGWRVIADIADFGIARLDPEGRISGWNRGEELITGLGATQVLGRPMIDLVPKGGRRRRRIEAGLARGRLELEGWLHRPDGSRCYVHHVAARVRDAGGRDAGFVVIGRDGTERKRHQELLAAALAIFHAILAGRELEEVLRLLTSRARKLLQADSAMVCTPEPGGQALVVRSAEGLAREVLLGMRLPVAETVSGFVHASGRARAFRDIQRSRWGVRPLVRATGFGPALLVPLAAEGRGLGTLVVANRRRRSKPPVGPVLTVRRRPGGRFGALDLAQLRLFAGQAGIALRQAEIRGDRRRLAVMEERERISRELHDGAIQSLYAVGLGLGPAARGEDEAARRRLAEVGRRVEAVIGDLRGHISELRAS